MKKVINGAMYNTETAKKLDYYQNIGNTSDFNWYKEELYRTKSGKYFLYGKGGPMSKYAESAGNNSWTGGSQIIPMNRQSAMEWAAENLDGEEYEAIFGKVEEGEEVVNIVLPANLKQKLWEEAETEGKSLTDLIVEKLSN